MHRSEVPGVLEPLLGLVGDGGVQGEDARARHGAGLPREQLPVDRRPNPGDPARNRGVQLDGEQRHRGHVWDNFSSETYKSLPAVGNVNLRHPVTGEDASWPTPGGGRGYQRVPSLVSIWATAPFLHNNEIGTFTGDPSVAGRMRAFDDGIRKLLWPRDAEVTRSGRTRADRNYSATSPTARPTSPSTRRRFRSVSGCSSADGALASTLRTLAAPARS